MGDGSQRTQRTFAWLTLAVGALFFLLSGVYSGAWDDSIESTWEWDEDLVALIPQILIGLGTSLLFVSVGYLVWELHRWASNRGFARFFGAEIARGERAVWLVHPHYRLVESMRADAAIWEHCSADDVVPGLPIEFEESIATNDIQALMYVAEAVQTREGRAPVFQTDTDWRAFEGRRGQYVPSAVSAGLTANLMRQAWEDRERAAGPGRALLTTVANGDARPAAHLPDGTVVLDGEDGQHGLIVRYAPDREHAPGKRWFLVAGLGPVGTPAAGLFLGSRWRELARLVPQSDDFIAVVTVPAHARPDDLKNDFESSRMRLSQLFRRPPGGEPIRVALSLSG